MAEVAVVRTSSVAGSRAVAAALAALVAPGDVIVLGGDLGAGKTAFTQGFGCGARRHRAHHEPDLHDRARLRRPAGAAPPRRVPAGAPPRGARPRPGRDARRGRGRGVEWGDAIAGGAGPRLPRGPAPAGRRRRRPRHHLRAARHGVAGPLGGAAPGTRACAATEADVVADRGSGPDGEARDADPGYRDVDPAGRLRHRRARGRAGVVARRPRPSPCRAADARRSRRSARAQAGRSTRSASSQSTSDRACSPGCGSGWQRRRRWRPALRRADDRHLEPRPAGVPDALHASRRSPP